jgi:hypothetical protein
MMTPKEKAKELVDKFQKQIFFDVTNERLDIEESKGCALIAVEEVMVYLDQIMLPNPFKQYWNEVKHEIEKL